MNWLVDAAADCTPPRADADGFGNRAAGSVPLAMFDAFVVSVVADAARPETFAAGRLPVTMEPRFTAPQEGTVPPMRTWEDVPAASRVPAPLAPP
jgi:hypothetical protein